VASYYAISQNLHLGSPNEAFFAAAIRLLPGWLLGLVAAGASLSGLLVLTGICLAIGPIVTRNLLPAMPETKQKASAKMVIVVYLLLSIVMTLLTPNLMLTLINTAYYGVTQFFPGVIVILFSLRVKPAAIVSGILTGQILAIVLYVMHIELGGFNIGLFCLFINVAVTAAMNIGGKRKHVHAMS
jgi:SSS family solute:Na+ symporter